MTTKKRNISVLLAISVVIFSSLACNAVFPQTQPTATTQPTLSSNPQGNIPLTEAEVPRITAEEAKVAYDSGKAIIVDVRSADSYVASHIAGAISIPLGEIELNPTGLDLRKEKWIITYCT